MSTSDPLTALLGTAPVLEPIHPIDGAAAGLDLEWAAREGAPNLVQSLTVAFVTRTGSDAFNLNFGFDGLAAIAEETDANLRRERIRMAVISTLRKEPRITRILTVRFEGEGASPNSGTSPRNVGIEATFEVIGGEVNSIAIGGEMLDVR